MIKPELLVPQVNTVGLVAYYKLQYGVMTTSKVFDYSLNGFTGTTNGPTVVPVYPGFFFDGGQDSIDIGSGPSSVKTVLMWVNPTDIAGTDYPLDLNGTDFLTIVTGTLTINGFAGGTANTYVDGIKNATAITAKWHLIGITDTSAKNATDFDIGKETTNFFAGVIGDVMLFDRVLSVADIKSIYEVTRGRYGV